MDNRSVNEQGVVDQVAVALSGLCLLHCLLLPIAIVLLPFLGRFDESHFHVQLLLLVIPVSLFALTLGYRRHADKRVLVSAGIGLALLIIGGTIVHAHYGVSADRALTILGSVILAVTHYRNSKLSRNCRGLKQSG